MVFFAQIDAEKMKQLCKAMKRPVGTFLFDITYEYGIFNRDLGKLTLMDMPSGQTIFRLERESNLDVHFIKSLAEYLPR